MRFNPLWLMLLFLFLFSGGWILLMPLFLVMILLCGGIFFAGASMRGLAKAPRQIWDVLFDARVRANLPSATRPVTCSVGTAGRN